MRRKKVKSYTRFKYILLFFLVQNYGIIYKQCWEVQYYMERLSILLILKCTSAIYIVYR